MRRAPDRRRAPGLRPRPRPAAYGVLARPRLDDEPRRARRAGLRAVEEPVGRHGRRGARARPDGRQGAHAAQAAGDGGRRRPPRRAGHRDQAPHPLRRAGRAAGRRAARRLRLGRRRQPGPGDELLPHRAPADQAAGPRRRGGHARREGAPLADAAPRGRRRLDHRARHRRAARAPGTGPVAGPLGSPGPRVDRQHRGRPAAVPRPRRHGGHHRPAGARPRAPRRSGPHGGVG